VPGSRGRCLSPTRRPKVSRRTEYTTPDYARPMPRSAARITAWPSGARHGPAAATPASRRPGS
jgi:hypothetical protein